MVAIIAGVLIAMSLLVETLGFYLRFAGSHMGTPSLGYSIHVQAGTLSRIGTLVGLPLIGWLIDRGANVHNILVVPVCTFAVYTAVNLIALFRHDQAASVSRALFRKLAKRSIVLNEGGAAEHFDTYDLEYAQAKVLYVAGILSFLFTASGFFLAAIFASVYYDYRATILQLSPIVTAIGTFVSVVFFDPRISYHVDRGAKQRQVIKVILVSRAISAAALGLLAAAWLMYA